MWESFQANSKTFCSHGCICQPLAENLAEIVCQLEKLYAMSNSRLLCRALSLFVDIDSRLGEPSPKTAKWF